MARGNIFLLLLLPPAVSIPQVRMTIFLQSKIDYFINNDIFVGARRVP